jgi:hypothetical protein
MAEGARSLDSAISKLKSQNVDNYSEEMVTGQDASGKPERTPFATADGLKSAMGSILGVLGAVIGPNLFAGDHTQKLALQLGAIMAAGSNLKSKYTGIGGSSKTSTSGSTSKLSKLLSDPNTPNNVQGLDEEYQESQGGTEVAQAIRDTGDKKVVQMSEYNKIARENLDFLQDQRLPKSTGSGNKLQLLKGGKPEKDETEVPSKPKKPRTWMEWLSEKAGEILEDATKIFLGGGALAALLGGGGIMAAMLPILGVGLAALGGYAIGTLVNDLLMSEEFQNGIKAIGKWIGDAGTYITDLVDSYISPALKSANEALGIKMGEGPVAEALDTVGITNFSGQEAKENEENAKVGLYNTLLHAANHKPIEKFKEIRESAKRGREMGSLTNEESNDIVKILIIREAKNDTSERGATDTSSMFTTETPSASNTNSGNASEGANGSWAPSSSTSNVSNNIPLKGYSGLGSIATKYETGGRGAGVISTGHGDFGGKSYGKYQLASKQGQVDAFLKSSGYASQFSGMRVGSAEFDNKWKQLANLDPNFGNAQQEYIKNTHYDPQMRKLQKAGIDLTGKGAAVQEAVFSTSVQHGPNASIIQKALAGKNISGMSDADIVSTIQDYKAANVNTNFRSSSAGVRKSVARRIQNEKQDLLKLAALGTSNNNVPPLLAAPTPALEATQAPALNAAVSKNAELQSTQSATPITPTIINNNTSNGGGGTIPAPKTGKVDTRPTEPMFYTLQQKSFMSSVG